jgi:hypothetical protein
MQTVFEMKRRLVFYVDAYSPETIPMAKLAEYMSDFAALLGRENAVHFAGLESGSTQIAAIVEPEDLPKVNPDSVLSDMALRAKTSRRYLIRSTTGSLMIMPWGVSTSRRFSAVMMCVWLLAWSLSSFLAVSAQRLRRTAPSIRMAISMAS